jgi:hypothetical protein
MKRYNLTPNGAQVDDNGVWVKSEDVERLRGALEILMMHVKPIKSNAAALNNAYMALSDTIETNTNG